MAAFCFGAASVQNIRHVLGHLCLALINGCNLHLFRFSFFQVLHVITAGIRSQVGVRNKRIRVFGRDICIFQLIKKKAFPFFPLNTLTWRFVFLYTPFQSVARQATLLCAPRREAD